MAEAPAPRSDRGDKKEEKPSHPNFNVLLTEIIGIVILLFLLGRFFGAFGGSAGGSAGFKASFSAFLERAGLTGTLNALLSTALFFSAVLSMLFILGIIYTLIRIHSIEKEWRAKLYPDQNPVSVEEPKNERWQRVIDHINSDNASDWRLAILECDIVLDELLDKQGFIGNTIGDKLKNADPAEFKTLNNAWEAHKIRNAIAHAGQDFTLTQREARRIVGLYETVFKEFDFV
jgi:hypothetical protein